MCPDGRWRFIITLEDAIAGGFNTAASIACANRYNRDTFNMLAMCACSWTAGQRHFRSPHVERCCVDPDIWEDHDENLPRPFGNREVWASYDPTQRGLHPPSK